MVVGEGRWDSTRVAQLGSIGQEEEAKIRLLLHHKAVKSVGHGQWDFKAAKAMRMLRPPYRNLETSPPRKPSHSSWVHMTQDPHSSTVLWTYCHHSGRTLSAMSS